STTPPAVPTTSASPTTSAPPTTSASQTTPPSQNPRALLDKCGVPCHSERLKTANLSLQGLDLTKVADHAEVWEKGIRKLRAGGMPPPSLPRPALAENGG